jgi:hypothetical protein
MSRLWHSTPSILVSSFHEFVVLLPYRGMSAFEFPDARHVDYANAE